MSLTVLSFYEGSKGRLFICKKQDSESYFLYEGEQGPTDLLGEYTGTYSIKTKMMKERDLDWFLWKKP
jgi:hypothetical protein